MELQSTTETASADDVQDIPAASYPNPEPTDSSRSPSRQQAVEEGDVDNPDDLSHAIKHLSLEGQSDSSLPGNEPGSLGTQPLGPDPAKPTPEAPLYDDPSSDEDDGQGEWITPDNVALHKSRALELLPSPCDDIKKRNRAVGEETILAGCMTADFAMQNVLLQMGLSLVGTEGKRIQKVKTWALRCHACFK